MNSRVQVPGIKMDTGHYKVPVCTSGMSSLVFTSKIESIWPMLVPRMPDPQRPLAEVC